MRFRSIVPVFFVILLFFCCSTAMGSGKCNSGPPFNPVTDPYWPGVFPIKSGNVEVISGDSSTPDWGGGTSSPICTCKDSKGIYLGVDMTFWEPAYLVEVVKDAFCMPSLGTSMSTLDNGWYSGSQSKNEAAPKYLMNTHWWKGGLLDMIGALTDTPCKTTGMFDLVGIPTEVDFTRQVPATNQITDPTGILVASPVFDIGCAVVAAEAQVPVESIRVGYDSLYYCWWGNMYPTTTDRVSKVELETSTTMVAREIFLKYQQSNLSDDVANACMPIAPVLPKKSHFRMQMVRPTRGGKAFVPGASEYFWGIGMNPPYHDGNFLYLLFKKRRCCIKIKGA